jgi:hypothetical protein
MSKQLKRPPICDEARVLIRTVEPQNNNNNNNKEHTKTKFKEFDSSIIHTGSEDDIIMISH